MTKKRTFSGWIKHLNKQPKVKTMKKDPIRERVYGYPTQYKEGFTNEEMAELVKEYPGIDMEKFNDAMTGNTCMMRGGKIINYHCDVEKAIRCGVEKRNLRAEEWD